MTDRIMKLRAELVRRA